MHTARLPTPLPAAGAAGLQASVVRSLERRVVRTPAPARRDRVRRARRHRARTGVPFPLLVICELLGVPGEEWPRFYEWSEAVIPGAERAERREEGVAAARDVQYLVGVAEGRRSAPRDDVVSALARATSDGDLLSEAELAMFLIQLLVAGNETSRNLVAGVSTHSPSTRAVGVAARRAEPGARGGRRAAALDHAGDLVPADGHL